MNLVGIDFTLIHIAVENISQKSYILIKISHLTGDDREDFLEELDDDAESSVPELEVAPESQLEEEEGSINDWSMSPLAASTEVAFSTSPWF